jgi:hypothetical protein
MSHFDAFQANSSVPLFEELGHFLFFVPGGGHKLLTPEGSVVVSSLSV